MLKILRHKNVSKLVLWAILILILPAFVLWGVGNLSRSKDGGPKFVGTINNKKVSFDDLAASMHSIRTQIILSYFNQPQISEVFLKNNMLLAKLAWDRLVMLREARKYRFKISDRDVINYIKSHPMFSRNGQFDERMYQYILRYNIGLAPRDFEEMMREHVMIQRMNDSLTKDIKVSDEDILNEYKKDTEKFKISYAIADLDTFKPKVSVDDTAVRDYYEKNKAMFATPTGKPAVFEEIKETIKSHLVEQEAIMLSLKYAEDIYKKVNETSGTTNKSFEDIVSEFGLKTAQSPFFGKTDYIEGVGEATRIADAAVKLKPGEISAPIETRKGFMVFKMLEVEKFDEEKFKKDKELYTTKALERKKNAFLEKWLTGLILKAKLNINFEDIDKYYQ